MAQRHLRLFQPFSFAFVLQRTDHLRQPHRRRRHIRGITREVHAAGHVIQRLLLHLLLDLAGMTKAEHRHATDHQRYRHHQQVKYQQATAGAGEERGA